ncbi:MAG TPA: hypothetical protein VD908_17115 [Cytophagales bacterium]|nr:hypothetical protein [Cytophagales bacterium]
METLDITVEGYKSLKKSPFFFEVIYTPEGLIGFAPMAIEIIADSEEDVKEWMRIKHPEKVIIDIISNL